MNNLTKKLAPFIIFTLFILSTIGLTLFLSPRTKTVTVYLENDSIIDNVNVSFLVDDNKKINMQLGKGTFNNRNKVQIPVRKGENHGLTVITDNGQEYTSIVDLTSDTYISVQIVKEGNLSVEVLKGEDFVFTD